MGLMIKIIEIHGREILDSRGNPTVEGFHNIPQGTSKATGIDWLCRHMGIKNEDTYAIGDSVNDLDMLSFVGHGIAMGNGTPPAKEAAEFVTTDIYDDGIKHAMEHYGLI